MGVFDYVESFAVQIVVFFRFLASLPMTGLLMGFLAAFEIQSLSTIMENSE